MLTLNIADQCKRFFKKSNQVTKGSDSKTAKKLSNCLATSQRKFLKVA